MKCPHCLESFHGGPREDFITQDSESYWAIMHEICPACHKVIIHLISGAGFANPPGKVQHIRARTLVNPKGVSRIPVPNEVPKEIAEDYKEACLVLTDSSKASAALSRRCLQNLLRNAAKVTHGNLHDEIQEVLDSGKLPTQLAESIDSIRVVGNFSAHPLKSKVTGEIVPVEPQEAEWNLDVLEALFDFYYVQPAVIAKKRAALNEKLSSAGKPPMK